MLIALIGPPGAGKASVAQFLAQEHGFRLITLGSSDGQGSIAGSSHAPLADSKSTSKDPSDIGSSHATPKDSLHAFVGSQGASLAESTIQLPNSKTMLDYVTDRWNDRFVTLDLTTFSDLDAFIKRPFFLCVEVAGPLLMRWERYSSKHGPIGLEDFVRLDDSVLYGSGSSPDGLTSRPMLSSKSSSSIVGGNGIVDNIASISLSPFPSNPVSGLTALRRYTHLSINNTHPNLDLLYEGLRTLDLPSNERLRPGWDTYFLKLCNLASLRSNCMKRRVGAVLVATNRILATGYNGTPSGLRNCNQGGCARCNNTLASTSQGNGCGQNLEECLCLHAEENALLEAGRGKIASEGATMYCNTCPCLRCAVKIVQMGIRRVVYQLEYGMDQRTKGIFKEAGVEILQFHLDA
ncbi:CMP/dCMP deaminase, zinc-binding [Kalmanozyma brasiliensis GHG001]|uniref:Deoxycytidylate deaminase n=1 Tax=Kalmanozyma brasiliensis (strain GHG001) TaxID=1365824 RepID=V5EJP7_KALBG|nr:CMP/dCMP deaminase, zinc-binding [Kalmanozyma brasiliensis GHG001]EST05010.1 CMP/dCMP deaminase, zinc-binding [Kalmanozyma brasiliensis GHG001]